MPSAVIHKEDKMIKINELEFGYSAREPLFRSLNLELAAGNICGLLGKNGSGKTTLLKLITGLLFPEAGEINVLGAIPRKRQQEFLKDVYFLPESLLLPRVTGDEYVKLFGVFYPGFDHNFYVDCMKTFNLPRNKKLTELSHGQKRKFSIVFGLSTQCKLIIFDEPTNGLDIPSKAEFRKLMASSIKEDQLFIISTHQVHDVEHIIDSIVILDEGQIVFNHNLMETSQHLAFKLQPDVPAPDESFYYEKRLGGYLSVMYNREGAETDIDLEVLFNAVISNKQGIQQSFKEVNHESIV